MTQEHNMSLNELAERYRLIQDGMVVAEASGPGSRAEIGHYYAVYSQDGPCHIEKKGAKRWTALRALSALGQSRSSMGGEG